MTSLLLAGDIGGTNTRLRLEQQQGEERHFLYENSFTNEGDFVSIVTQFLREAAEKLGDFPTIQKACFAVAGPVDREHNTCKLTNLNWDLDGARLAQDLSIAKVQLINDFEAIGYGVSQLKGSEEREILQEGEKEPPQDAPLAVIGAGTGLGEAFIIKDKQGTEKVYPTEGGHVDFAPRSQKKFKLLQYIQETYQLDHVSVERVVSGPGIAAIYQFLRDCPEQEYSEPGNVREEVLAWQKAGCDLSKAPGSAIARAAEAGDPLCSEAMEMFVSAYGSEVGNFAVKILPYGGLYVAGGIAPKVLKKGSNLRQLFLQELRDKGRMKPVIEKIPIYLVKNEKVGLLGAARYATFF